MKKVITMGHGNGGRLMHELVNMVRRELSNPILNEMGDAAEFPIKGARLAFSTDSYVVKPLFFPGGDIGKLAVYGTVNDLSMKGAKPLYLSLAFIIEEGCGVSLLQKIIVSIKMAARQSKVCIVTGDIKVVERGSCDKLFINTAGVGIIRYAGKIGVQAWEDDVIIINGGIAEHGIAILNARENLGFISTIKSDCKNLNFEVEKCLKASKNISVMRDLTRGGLATSLNEIAQSSNLGIEIDEKSIPIKLQVKSMCDVLGFDPLYIANEGKFICFVQEQDAAKLMSTLGSQSAVIGKVTGTHKNQVYLNTVVGSSRILPMLESDQLPRIC